MAFKLPSRVKETTTTTGTGTYALGGALSTAWRTFAAAGMANGDTTFYYCESDTGHEFGIGTWNTGGTLTRTTILGSSNGGSAVSWAAGAKIIGIGLTGPNDLAGANIALMHGAMGIKSFKNVLHNGGFQVAQRGNGPFTSATTFVNNDDTYLVDGCIFLANGSDTCDITINSSVDPDFVSGRKLRLDVETANRRFGVLFPIENAAIQAIRKSGKASVQFKVKQNGTSLTNVRAYLLAWNSTADAITSDVISAWGSADGDPTFVANWTAENAGSNLAVSTGIATHRIENITVDTASVANLALLIISNPTTTTIGDVLEIGDVQVEEGVNATEYEHRPIGVDLALCQRYLRLLGAGMVGQWLTSSTAQVAVAFDFEMRAAPTFASISSSFTMTECGVAARTCTGSGSASFVASGGSYVGSGAASATVGKVAISGSNDIAIVSAEL